MAAPGTSTGPDVPTRKAARILRLVQRNTGVLGVVPAAAVTPAVRAVPVGGADPMKEPKDYPLTMPGPRPPEPTTLTVVGDLMLTRGVADPAGALQPLSRAAPAALT